MDSSKELHNTPFGTQQQFLYCYCRVELTDDALSVQMGYGTRFRWASA